MSTRTEHDTLGPIAVSTDKLWGKQTQRSLQNFDISGQRQPLTLIRALAVWQTGSGYVTSEDFDRWVVPQDMTGHGGFHGRF